MQSDGRQADLHAATAGDTGRPIVSDSTQLMGLSLLFNLSLRCLTDNVEFPFSNARISQQSSLQLKGKTKSLSVGRYISLKAWAPSQVTPLRSIAMQVRC